MILIRPAEPNHCHVLPDPIVLQQGTDAVIKEENSCMCLRLCILPRCPFCQHKNVDGCILAYRARRNNRAGRSEREHEANNNEAAIERHL